MEKKIQNLMEILGCDEQTAKEIIADDERIDKGEKLFEQTADQKANSKKYVNTGTRKTTVYNLNKRERKTDLDKARLIELLASAVNMVTANEDDLTVTNAERQIDFVYNGRKFRIVLSCPRG